MKIAAIDVGLKRIGVALSLVEGIITPHEAILRKNRNQAALRVIEFLKTWEVELLVVGLPFDGESSEEMQRRIKHFVALVGFENVKYINEYGSSYEAKQIMRGIIKQKRDGKVDSIAAGIILERYFESLKN